MSDTAAPPPAPPPVGRRGLAAAGALPPQVVVLLGLAAAVAVLGGLRVASTIVGPLVLAFVIAVGVYPLQRLLSRYLPRGAATLVTMAVTYAGILGFVGLLAVSGAQLAEELPAYADETEDLVRDALEVAQRFGVTQDQIDDAVGVIDPGSLFTVVGSALTALVGTLGNLLFVLLLLFFLLVDATTVPQRMGLVTQRAPRAARSLRTLTAAIRRFIVVTTVFGAVIAVVDVGILYAFGVPLPLLWGLLSFVTNYIPNVGLIIGLVPPTVVALLDEGPVTALWVATLWVLANFLIQTLLQPKIVGDAVGLSVTATVVSVFVWGWVLGPLGALLAVPLSLAAKALLLDEDSPRGWVSLLTSSWTAERQQLRQAPGGT